MIPKATRSVRGMYEAVSGTRHHTVVRVDDLERPRFDEEVW